MSSVEKHVPADAEAQRFRKVVYSYYSRYGRHELPWRNTRSPYRIVVSEFMLQQTQVARVRGRYAQWLDLFPDFEALAAAPLREVLAAWSGLGYNRRARFLHELAKRVCEEYGGRLPADIDSLRTLPGVGEYTAAAIAAFAYEIPVACVETNIRRALIYAFFSVDVDYAPQRVSAAVSPGWPEVAEGVSARRPLGRVHDREIRGVANAVLDRDEPRRWNFALMDWGAMIGANTENPNRHSAHYTRQSRFAGSRREVRGAIIRSLSQLSGASVTELSSINGLTSDRLESALSDLAREGLIEQKHGRWQITD